MATIEIDEKPYEVETGKMIIEVTDELGIHIPRFCYHKKLSVAANCRMCLVQVEKSRKPLPACATPIMDGMKIFTQSEETLRSQKAVMEFLLINHPLDCPICDQGGECELQDVSLGFGAGTSAYNETKRAFADDHLGALISTEMTRCIHCTRCVRFGEEVAGVRELGALGRGEHMQIGTYVQHAMTSEVSGNIIDLCPVGALTSRPYRFTARAWEMSAFPAIAPHDCLGSHLDAHVRRQDVMRVVPREQESLNEVWLSDRDRFSYTGLSHPQRATQPKIKRNGQWEVVDWQTALLYAVEQMQTCLHTHGPEQFAAFSTPSATLEEQYLLQKWMRAMGVHHLDHRLQQADFRDQDHMALYPQATLPYATLEKQNTILLLGTHLHRDVPLAAVRVRKAALAGAKVFAVNPMAYAFPFEVTAQAITAPHEMVLSLGKVLLSVVKTTQKLPAAVQTWLKGVTPDETAQAMAEALKQGDAVIVTGAVFENHPEAARLRTLLHCLREHLPAVQHLPLTVGSNAAGAWLAGMVPHRQVGGQAAPTVGLSVREALAQSLKGYCVLGAEPGYDFANPALAKQAFAAAECVVVLTAFESEEWDAYADVILPVGVFTETSGTAVNLEGSWQTTSGCSALPDAARPAWKVLRVLANLMKYEGFSYDSTEAVRAEIHAKIEALVDDHPTYQPWLADEAFSVPTGLVRVGEWPLYGVDSLVRHAQPLQRCAAADKANIRMHPETIARLGLGERAAVSQGAEAVVLPLQADVRVAPETVWVLNGLSETMMLGDAFSEVICEGCR